MEILINILSYLLDNILAIIAIIISIVALRSSTRQSKQSSEQIERIYRDWDRKRKYSSTYDPYSEFQDNVNRR